MKRYPITLIYGLFLVWLLSFLYNGPIAHILFFNRPLSYIGLTYILTPAIFYFLAGITNKKNYPPVFILRSSLVVTILLTTAMILFYKEISAALIYFLSGCLGLTSVLFISAWGHYFVISLKRSQMFAAMGITIALGKLIYSINTYLCQINLYILGIFVMYSCLFILFYILFFKMPEIQEQKSVDRTVNIPFQMYFLLGLSVVCINISGGYILDYFYTSTDTFYFESIFDILIYTAVVTLFLLFEIKDLSSILVNFVLALLGVSMTLFILFSDFTMVAYPLITISFLALDIVIWTITAKLGSLSNRSYKVLFITMSLNLFAVFIGATLQRMHITKEFSLVICISFILLSFTFMQLTFKSYDKLKLQYNQTLSGTSSTKLSVLEEMSTAFSEKTHFQTVKNNPPIKKTPPEFEALTEKEREVTAYLLKDEKIIDIAEHLYVSKNTIKTHCRHIYKKLNVQNKKHLIEKYKTQLNQDD